MSENQLEQIKIRIRDIANLPLAHILPFQEEIKVLASTDYQKLKEEILKDGFSFSPHVFMDSEGSYWLLDGHQRRECLSRMEAEGYHIPLIPCVVVDADDLEHARRMVLGAASQYGTIQEDKLSSFLTKVGIDGKQALERFRFREVKLERLTMVSAHLRGSAPDDIPEPPKEAITKRGDIYQLGDHRLMCGDSTMIDDVEKLMGGEKADMVFTDPPYNLGGHMEAGIFSNIKQSHAASKQLEKAAWDKDFDISPVLGNIQIVSAENCALYICTSHFLAGQIWEHTKQWCDRIGWCVWDKPNPAPSLQNRHWTWSAELICYATRGRHIFNRDAGTHTSNVWRVQVERHDTGHAAQKPVAIPEIAIIHSSDPKQTVLDLFGGSGSTLIACEKTDRKCLMMEIDPIYCDVIVSRWEKFTGKKAAFIAKP